MKGGLPNKDQLSERLVTCVLSCVRLFASPWTVAMRTCSHPLSVTEFSRQEYWSGLLFPPPGDLPT